MMLRVLFASTLLVAALAHATAPDDAGFRGLEAGPQDDISDAQRARIWREIEASQAKLRLPKAGERPAFRWPLRAARGYSDPGFETIVNFVDQDPLFPNQVKDWNCGARSYDQASGYNHRGIDISLWPDSWNVMAAAQVEVVAAAPGVIVLKNDGNPDRSCKLNADAPWNAVYVQHDDGSISWYGHLKQGSVTPKALGQRVEAGEFLGTVGSSGNSSGPHLHFEVYNAAHALVDPYAGPCNTKNAESWWAAQPPYNRPQVNRVVTASAAPVFGTCGADGTNTNPGTLNAKTAFAPGAQVVFNALVRDLSTDGTIAFTITRPDGSVWRTFNTAAPGQFFTAAYAYVTFTLEPTAPEGVWRVEATYAGTRAQSSFSVAASGTEPANYTDLWWNAAESGWGLNLVHQGEILFGTWFTYDADRGGLWLVMPDARRQPDGSFTGAIYRTTGTPLAQIDGAPATAGSPQNVGTATIRFTGATQASFSYTVNNVTQQKTVSRQVFSASATCRSTSSSRAHATNYQDLWWNPAESGWGLNLAHQGEILFATWFTYGAGGRGQWLVGSDVRRQPTGEYRGRLYRTSGAPFEQINGSPAVTTPAADVGQLTLAFSDGEHARMDYIVDGVAQSKAITRQVFGGTTPLCR